MRRLILAFGMSFGLNGCLATKPPRGEVPVERANAPVRWHIKQQNHWKVQIQAGSAYDPIGKEGLAHLVAQSFVEEINNEVEEASVSVNVGVEQVVFDLTCLDGDACLPRVFEILVDPEFSPTVITAAAGYASNKLDEILQDPSALSAQLLHGWMWESHPYSHVTYGRYSVISVLTKSEMMAFHRTHFVKETTQVVGPMIEEGARIFERLPSSIPADLPLQQGLIVQNPMALFVVGTDQTSGWALGHVMVLAFEDPDWELLRIGLELSMGNQTTVTLAGKDRRRVDFRVIGEGNPEALAGALVQLKSSIKDGISPELHVKLPEHTSPEAVHEVLQRYLRLDQLKIVIVVPDNPNEAQDISEFNQYQTELTRWGVPPEQQLRRPDAGVFR